MNLWAFWWSVVAFVIAFKFGILPFISLAIVGGYIYFLYWCFMLGYGETKPKVRQYNESDEEIDDQGNVLPVIEY